MRKCCLSKYCSEALENECAHCCMRNNGFLCCVNENGSRKIVNYVDRKVFHRKNGIHSVGCASAQVNTHRHSLRKTQKRISRMFVWFFSFLKSQIRKYSRIMTTTAAAAGCSVCSYLSLLSAVAIAHLNANTHAYTHRETQTHIHADTSQSTNNLKTTTFKNAQCVCQCTTIHSHIQSIWWYYTITLNETHSHAILQYSDKVTKRRERTKKKAAYCSID